MMKTAIKDNELHPELQELYLTGKQWLSDLHFLESEERFLSTQLNGMTTTAELNLLTRLDDASRTRRELAGHVEIHMRKLELLIANTDCALQLQLVDDLANLQAAVHTALSILKEIKYALIVYRKAA